MGISGGEDGPMNEAMFGAQVIDDRDENTKIDYYVVAHRIKEKVTNSLCTGCIKDPQPSYKLKRGSKAVS